MPAQARYDILASCVLELHRVGILDRASPTPLPHSQLPAPIRWAVLSDWHACSHLPAEACVAPTPLWE